MGRSKLALASLATFVALVAPARAQAQSAQDKAAAEAAFDEGKRLMTAHAFADACPKFAESLRRDPGLGTMLGLADCYEKNGQTASAWAEFHEAASVAARKSDKREALARENVARLEPLLSKILVRVPHETDVRGLVVKRDGVDLGRALWDEAVPVDPGVHAVSAAAPGFKEWQISVDAPPTPGVQTVTVPRLETAPEPIAPPATPTGRAATTPPPETNAGSTQRVVGIAAAGAGVIGVVIGSVLGLVAKSKLDQSNADDHCDPSGCDDTGLSLRHSAVTAATGSTVGFIAGGVLIAGGAVLWFTAPHPSSAPPDSAHPQTARLGLAPTPNGVVLVGRW